MLPSRGRGRSAFRRLYNTVRIVQVLLLKMDRALSPALRCAALVYRTNGEIICG